MLTDSSGSQELLRAYETATSSLYSNPEVESVKRALRSAIKSAEMQRRGPQATLTDALQIRNIFDEPALRELIDSPSLDPSLSQRFRDLEIGIIRGQPLFPDNLSKHI